MLRTYQNVIKEVFDFLRRIFPPPILRDKITKRLIFERKHGLKQRASAV
jgi:hypothetical protein